MFENPRMFPIGTCILFLNQCAGDVDFRFNVFAVPASRNQSFIQESNSLQTAPIRQQQLIRGGGIPPPT